MNLDRFNPLSSNFIYKQPTTKEPQPDAKLNTNADASDWGIDEDLVTPASALGTTLFSNYVTPASSSPSTVHTNNPFQAPPPPPPISNRQSSYSNHSNTPLMHDDTFIPPHPTYINQQSSQSSPFKRRGSVNSNSSSQFNQHYHQHQALHHHPLQRSHSQASQLSVLQYCQYSGNVIYPNTETLSKFIRKYLSMESKMGEFWEKFKYNLIISNLLGDSMILSKNESNLQLLSSNPIYTPSKHLKFTINDDGTRLIVLNTTYNLKYNYRYNNFSTVLLIINLIIYLLKQQQSIYFGGRHHMSHESQFSLFKFIIVVSSKLIKVRKFKTTTETNKILALLNDFLKLNYTVNKNLILSMVKLKSQKLDLVQGNASSTHLLNSLSFLILSLRSFVVKLLPHMNGELFQQYCTINNINMNILTQEFDSEDQDDLEEVIFNINKFNQLRKLFICQLIIINENAQSNFFTLNLMDQFQIGELESDLSTFDKMKLIYDVLADHNDSVKTINKMFSKVDTMSQPQPTTSDEDLIPSLNSNLFQFTSRINKFAHNLNYFNKYNQSLSLDNIEEQYEKLAIFQQFRDELNQLKLLHKQTLQELNQEINPDYVISNSPKSTVSTSPQATQTPTFNLKTFNNPSIKKRYSLPPNVTTADLTTTNGNSNGAAASPTLPSPGANTGPSSKTKKYKRLSTGLQLGLLTVFEENGDRVLAPAMTRNRNSSTSSTSGRAANTVSTSSAPANPSATSSSTLLPPPKVSYDDNYINILPTNEFESYNKSTLDQLISNKAKHRNSIQNRNSINMSRFSLNSVQSNVSGISDLISTQLTSFNGDEVDDSELEPKLELSNTSGQSKQSDNQCENHDNGELDKQDANDSSVIDDSGPGQLTQEELKLKLEASFTRIYNLEAENKKLMMEKKRRNSKKQDVKEPNEKILNDITNESNLPDASFLKDLESKLNVN
ncbi:hypothetical protein I9W82_002408 [Candida metapsilosis]|uniref:Myosin-binding domain-containing protein n=1 Tax=Candida metapsilosis TaxID=273372 RepID=A0A8H7ZK92_9ASCO|nr:hypothetical protein I9W82_002408 [Candida metapsilosis]